MFLKFADATIDGHTLAFIGGLMEGVNLLLQLISHRSKWGTKDQRTFGPWKNCEDYGLLYNNSYWDGVGEQCSHYDDFNRPIVVFIVIFLLLSNMIGAAILTLNILIVVGRLQGKVARQVLLGLSVAQLFFCFMCATLGSIEYTKSNKHVGVDLILLWISSFLSVFQLINSLIAVSYIRD
ncbi:uncharacterized protein LOC142348363 [Convolutriloba macropyga]|uniref:uncharacterized protein LOC142348363 n=1 Tax=Convolutriloba macropyga TaxID=536237 RepID=UPI003F5260AC